MLCPYHNDQSIDSSFELTLQFQLKIIQSPITRSHKISYKFIIAQKIMSKLHIFALFIFLSSISITSCHKRIYYLYQNEAQQDHLTVEALKQNRQNHPVHKVDCKKFNCDKFKAPHYPALIFWNGPGTSYKSLYPTNHDGLQLYFKSQKEHPLKFIRDFMESITLVQAFGVAIAVATFLYFVFSFLFKDRSGLETAQSKKDL